MTGFQILVTVMGYLVIMILAAILTILLLIINGADDSIKGDKTDIITPISKPASVLDTVKIGKGRQLTEHELKQLEERARNIKDGKVIITEGDKIMT